MIGCEGRPSSELPGAESTGNTAARVHTRPDMRTHVVTGGAGYLARSLVRELAAEPVAIRRFFRAAHGSLPAPPGLATVSDVHGDVTVRAELERALDGADVVHHLAAQTSIYAAEADPVRDVSTNVLPLLYLVEHARAGGHAPLVLLASTVTIYGLSSRLPVDESFAEDPRSVYDLDKLAAERLLAHYAANGVVRGAALRLANVYGPGPASSAPDRGVLNAMVRRALAGERLEIYGTGAWLRDYDYVDDAARAFVDAARDPDAVNGRSFIVASGEGVTVAAAVRLVAELVEEYTGRRVEVGHVPLPARLSPLETRQFVGRSDAFRRATGWAPRVSFREGLKYTIEHCARLGASA
jgi:nucleoside-diphosphate-sugar epimerase